MPFYFWFCVGALCLMLGVSSTARADLLVRPPLCPSGSVLVHAPGGTRCRPSPCISDESCAERYCRSYRVCTAAFRVARGVGSDPDGDLEDQVVATCEPDAPCLGIPPEAPTAGTRFGPRQATQCEVGMFCVDHPAPLPRPAPPERAERPLDEPPLLPPIDRDDHASVPRPHGLFSCVIGSGARDAPWALMVLGLALLRGRRRL